MRSKEVPAQAVNVKEAVILSTTCTSDTVSQLNSYLFPESSVKPTSDISRTAIIQLPKSRQAQPKRNARARKRPEVTIHETPEADLNPITSTDQGKLATEIINAVLQSFTESVKARSPAQGSCKEKMSHHTTSPNSTTLSPTERRCPEAPLQPLSVNIACSDKGQCKESRRSSRQTTCSDGIRAASGFAAQAECARLAFSALRALDARGALAKKLPFLRLENAMSTLVNKLIALELFEPAHRQLRVLRISLLVAAKGAEKTGSSTHGELGNKERITDLLSFPCASVKGPLLSMIVTFQFQVLRLIAAKRDGSLFRATWEHLQPANPHSPANLIQAQHDPADPGTSAKIANQLEALSRLVLSICPVVLSPEDKKSVRSETMDPLTALRLQILALEIRSLWWSIAGHKGDIAKELLVPFSQYLSTFRQRSAKHVEEGYGSAKSALASLALSAPDGDRFLNATTGFNEAWLSIFSDMSELCATVGLSNEGRDWLEKYTRVRMDNGASPCKRCTLTCKKAVLYAQVSASLSCDAELANAFREAGHLIEGSLDGSSEELDELLLVLIKLRKAAGVIINRSRIIPEKPEGPPESNLIRQCYSICSACVKFLSKYIGSRPSQSVDHRLNFRYQQRLKQALAVTTAFVQTVTSIARLTKADDPEEWVHTDSGLQACLLLATVTQEGHQDTEGNARDHHDTLNAFVSVSHAYWLRYSHLKLTDGDNREALKALKASINAVEHRPLACKIAAQLHLRFEHYANTLESVREHGKALEIYTKAARLHIEMGVLQKVATAAATQSPSMIFARHSDLSPWGRVLSAYITVAIRMETEMSATRMIYDDESLESIQRGIALEHQLYSLIAVLEKTPDPPLMSMAIQRLARDLLALYSEQAFPIRRLRVIVAILWLDSGRPKLFPPELMDALLEYKFDRATSKCHGADSGLQLLRPYLSASRDAVLAMQEECPIRKQQMLKSALATWYLLIEESLDLNALEARVGDPAPWLLHLELLARYLEAYGLGLLRQSVLQLITTLREKFFPTQDKELMLNLVQSGLQYSRLGFFQHAGLAFHKVQKYFDKGEDFGEAAVWFYVAYAEYFLMIGSFGKCREHLERAQRVFESHEHDHARGIAAINRKKLPHLMADVASLHSDFAARCGNTSRALLLARQSLKLVLRAWASIERRQKSSKIDNGDMDGNSGVGGLVDSISKTTVADHDSIKNGRTVDRKGSAYWPVVPQLHKALLQVSQLYANEGLFGEASYYSEQSRKLVESASAQSLAVRSISHQADLLTRRGNYVEADIKIAFASRQFELLEEDQYLLQFQLNLIHYHLVKGQSPAAEDICLAAKSLLQHLTHSDRTRRDLHDQHDIFALQAQLSQLTLRADELRAPDPKRRAPTKTAAKRSGPVGKGTKTQVASSSDKETLSLALYQMRCKVIRQQTMLAVRKGNFDEAKLLLDEASKYYRTLEDTVLHAMLNSEVYFNRGLEGLSGDPVYCVLRESTISFPSVVSRPPPKPITPSKACSAKACGNLAKRGTVGADSKRVRTAPQADGDRPGHDFQKAMVELGKVYQRAKSVCPTAALHDLSKIMAEIIVKLSALNLANFEQGFKGSPSTLLGIIDMARSVSVLRGRFAVRVDEELPTGQNLLTWPNANADDIKHLSIADEALDPTAAQEQYLHLVPHTWQVLSISLDRSRREILVSRIRSGQGPFVLALPLDRHSSQDPDEESFNFHQAKTELQDILQLADESTHSNQDQSRKGFKSAWWDRRAALDARLKDLLTNIQNMWLGGFQGVFSQQQPPRELLSRFQESLDVVLDHHLPSRRGLTNKHKSQRVAFDPRVIELFVALGDPAFFSDMQEPLMDLLYFVIDILQFNGERNAYDEIDFDSMTVEILDALRQYHEAVKKADGRSAIEHTVLVLDKELHCFPWESLPCLDGQAVTRLPSLSCLRDRILQRKQQPGGGRPSPVDHDHKFWVDRRNGAYVLNPAGDLMATQGKFEQLLSDLSEWEGVTKSEPSEDQLKGYLQERNIFLYFGHGSGNQYIRSQTIQKLDKCAVALLMGCSSGKLTEAGEFEPYGTPMSYMQAGCPAMVATLWDVTDKDIDRFSETMLRKWGLFENQQSPTVSPVKKRCARAKGKSKALQSPSPDEGNLSLDQAVARGRASCIFRYLNGAAPVVYGIPIFLS